MRRGLPGELEKDVDRAIREIYLKYRSMKKGHLNKDRIWGIILQATRDTLSESEKYLKGGK